jgi:hypothetical protein
MAQLGEDNSLSCTSLNIIELWNIRFLNPSLLSNHPINFIYHFLEDLKLVEHF